MMRHSHIRLQKHAWAGKIILAILALIGVATLSLLLIIRTETFKDWVKGKINKWIVENIDGKVEIGSLGFELLPPRIYAENVSVSNPKGVKFLTSRRIEVIPDIVSLFQNDLDVQEIALTRPSIKIVIEDRRITNLPSMKKRPAAKGKKTVLETLSVINGDVSVTAIRSAPWDIKASISSINLDVTGQENIVFEVRLLTGPGSLQLGDVKAAIRKIESRTTVESTDEFQKLKIKHFSFDAGEIAMKLKESELTFKKAHGPFVLTNFSLSAPLPVASKLYAKLPPLQGYESCEGIFGYDEKVTFDAQCTIEHLWVKKYEVGTLSSRIIYKDDRLELKDAALKGGGGTLFFDASLSLLGQKELSFDGRMDGIDISKIFDQLNHRHCGVKFSGWGPISLKGTLGPVMISGEMDTEVHGFRVFTKDHKNPTAREVLSIPKGFVKSNLEITDKYFRFKNGQVKIQNTVLTTDTKLNFDKTMEITVQSPRFNGVDIKTIAKVPIKGTGTLRCSIQGKMKTPTVSGKGDLSGFFFAGVSFGNVNFKLDYKGNSTLLIPAIRAQKGRSRYLITDGQIVFRHRQEGGMLVEGKVFAEKLLLSDLRKIFNVQSHILETFEAESKGNLTIKYEPNVKRTTVDASLDLKDISAFGETFEKGSLQGQWNTDDINVQSLEMSGKLGKVKIVGRKSETDSIDFDVSLDNIKSKYIKAYDFKSVGVDFNFSTSTTVRGTLEMPVVDNAVVDIENFRLGKVKETDGQVIVNLRNNVLTLTAGLLGNKVLWKSITDLKKEGATEAVVDINDLQLDEQELAKLTGKLTGAKHTLGLEGSIKATAVLWDDFKLSGKAELTKLDMKFSEYELSNELPIALGFTQKSLSFENVHFKGEGTTIKVTGGLSTKGPAISLQGNVDMTLLKKFVDEIEFAQGTISPRLLLSGKWSKPYFLGEVSISCDALNLKTASLKFKSIAGNVSLNQDTMALNLAGDVSGGQFRSTGVMEMESLKPVSYEVVAEFNDVNVRLLKGVPIGLEGTLSLSRNKAMEGLPRLEGEVWVTSLRYTKDFTLAQQVENILFKKSAQAVTVYDKRKENFILDVIIHGSSKLSVKNNVADAGFRIDESQRPFKVVGTDMLPVMVGTIVVTKGTVEWKGRTFDLERGVIDFTNPVQTEAHFDILAGGEIKDWRIQLHAAGTPDDFVVQLSSDPELQEEDILLLIQFGMTREEMAKIENAQTVAAEVASQAIGLDTKVKQLIPIIDQFEITSEFSKTTNKVEPRVSIGKNLTDNIKLSAVSGLTDTESLEKGTYFKAVVEYKVTDSLSLQAAYDNAKGPESGQSSQQFGNVGVDMKWRIEF